MNNIDEFYTLLCKEIKYIKIKNKKLIFKNRYEKNKNIIKYKLDLSKINPKKLILIIIINKKIIGLQFDNNFIILIMIQKTSNNYRVSKKDNLEKLKEEINNSKFSFFHIKDKKKSIYKMKRNFFIEGLSCNNSPIYDDIAFYEYIERISMYYSNGKYIKGSYNTLLKSFKIVDLNKIGNYWENNKSQIIENDEECLWIFGKNIKNKTKLVPLDYVFYKENIKGNSKYIVNSNGNALGSSIIEAKINSILEVFERDTFLKYWYGNEYNIYKIKKINVLNIISRMKILDFMGYTVDFLYIDTKTNLKVVWCLIRSLNKKNIIYSVSGLSCKLNIEEAMLKSYEEAGTILNIRKNEKNILKKIKLVEENKGNFLDLDKIIYYYSSYNREKDYYNIMKNIDEIDFSKLKESKFNFNKLIDTLNFIISDIKTKYDDIIFVNQTPQFLKNYNLYCIKSIFENGWDISFSEVVNRFDRPNIEPIA